MLTSYPCRFIPVTGPMPVLIASSGPMERGAAHLIAPWWIDTHHRWRYSRPPAYPSRRVPVRPREPDHERTRGATREEIFGAAGAGAPQAARTQSGAAG